jgi:hypothetical protein
MAAVLQALRPLVPVAAQPGVHALTAYPVPAGDLGHRNPGHDFQHGPVSLLGHTQLPQHERSVNHQAKPWCKASSGTAQNVTPGAVSTFFTPSRAARSACRRAAPARRAGRAASPGRPAAPAGPRAGDEQHQDHEQNVSPGRGVSPSLPIVPVAPAASRAPTASLRDRLRPTLDPRSLPWDSAPTRRMREEQVRYIWGRRATRTTTYAGGVG